jgi:hypothetical protein
VPAPPDNGEGRAPRQRPGPASTFTATNGKPILPDEHCPRCACRCRCHQPPPEPPYAWAPPAPGSPFYSAHLAERRVTAA